MKEELFRKGEVCLIDLGGMPEKNKEGNAEYINGVIFKDEGVNVLKYREKKIKAEKQS